MKNIMVLLALLLTQVVDAKDIYQVKKHYQFINEGEQDKLDKFCKYAETTLARYPVELREKNCQWPTEINRNVCHLMQKIMHDAAYGDNDFAFNVSPSQQLYASTDDITNTSGDTPDDLRFESVELEGLSSMAIEDSFFARSLEWIGSEGLIKIERDLNIITISNRFTLCEMHRKNIKLKAKARGEVVYWKPAAREDVKSKYAGFLEISKVYFQATALEEAVKFKHAQALARLSKLIGQLKYLTLENGELGIKEYKELVDFEAAYFPPVKVQTAIMMELSYE